MSRSTEGGRGLEFNVQALMVARSRWEMVELQMVTMIEYYDFTVTCRSNRVVTA